MTFRSWELLLLGSVLRSGEGEIITFRFREFLLVVLVLYLERLKL